MQPELGQMLDQSKKRPMGVVAYFKLILLLFPQDMIEAHLKDGNLHCTLALKPQSQD